MSSKKQHRKPAAFLSYVHFDDEHEDGKISDLRKRLSVEVRAQTGDDFPIFQDRNDIQWGENWQNRIESAIGSSTFLIPILTPSFFKSPACRNEVKRFLHREKKLKRTDLILPIYYIDLQSVLAPRKNTDQLLESVFRHQYADWRELRFEPMTSPQVARMIAQLATGIRDALSRDLLTRDGNASRRGRSSARNVPPKPNLAANEQAEVTPILLTKELIQPGLKATVFTRVVDRASSGKAYRCIRDAILAANPGDRILVRPGIYEECLVIDKPLEILGDGPSGTVMIQVAQGDLITVRTSMGRLSNLTLRQLGHGNAVDIVQGRVEIEDCDITCDNAACVVIRDGADPRLWKNVIHGAGQFGVLVIHNGFGIIEDNDIQPLALAGISIMNGGNPKLRRNRFHQGAGNGAHISQNGLGVFEDNDFWETEMTSIIIEEKSNPVLRRNRIRGSKVSGVGVQRDGLGILESNEIFDNKLAGIIVMYSGSPTLRNNKITENEVGIRIIGEGGGAFEDNDLRSNLEGPWDISEAAKQRITRARNIEA